MDPHQPRPESPGLAARLATVVLGTERRMRLRMTHTLVAGAVYLLLMGVQWWLMLITDVDAIAALALTAAMATGNLLFIVAVRSGWSERFADPAMTMSQMLFAIATAAVGYRLNPDVRGSLLMLAGLLLMFGAFTLSPERCRRLAWLATAILGVAMMAGALTAPEQFPRLIEATHFVFTLATLPIVGLLAGQLSALRSDLQRQKRALRDALARLQTLATRDELTGLPNRRHLFEWIAHETSRDRRRGVKLGLALVDLDHFKRVNDTLGHLAGDAVLARFAAIASDVLRESDVIARWGGEEFLIAMPESDAGQVEASLRRLRAALADPTVWGACPGAPITFSAGLTEHAPGEPFELAIERADAALYRAKSAGRDRWVRAEPESPAAGRVGRTDRSDPGERPAVAQAGVDHAAS